MIRRLVVSLLGFLATLAMGLLGHPAEATPQEVPAPSSPSYDYDGHRGSEMLHDAVTERGPHEATYDHTIPPAVGSQSLGPSARLSGRTTLDIHHNGTSPLVQLDKISGTTWARARATEGYLSSFQRWQVAAKTAAKACSFAGATTVLMADGTKKPIEDIEVGDEVIATDPETGEQVAKIVEQVWVHDDTLLDLVVDGEVITTTEDHPFWSVTDHRFERADQLAESEKVLGADGRVVTVSGLELGTARRALAYNLTVEGIHTYHVGISEVLVHNTCNLYRFGNEAESADSLAAQAAHAEANGFPHGVSVFSKSSRPDAMAADRAAVESVFPVLKTGKNPYHHTVELPRPVTQEVADLFNGLFGRL